MKRGITCFSFYTGKLTGPFCMHKICQKELLDEFGFEYCLVPLATQAGTDNDAVCQMVMVLATRFDEQGDSQKVLKHAFASMESHMTSYGHELANGLTPPSDASIEEKIIAYKLMLELLKDSAKEVFQGGCPTAYCLIHEHMCPVFDTLVEVPFGSMPPPVMPITQPIDLTQESQVNTDAEEDRQPGDDRDERSGASAAGPDTAGSSGDMYMTATKLCDEPRHTHFEMGNSCTDFAGYGGHQGRGGHTNKPLAVLAAELLEVEPDTFTQEWVTPDTEGVFALLVSEKNDTVELEVNPTFQGKPVKRPRRLTSGWRRGRKQFHGSVGEYNLLFSSSLHCSGDVFFCNEYDKKRRSEALERARSNGFCFDSDDVNVSPEAHRLFKVGTVDMLKAHQAVRPQLQGSDGSYIVDLEHWPKFSKGGACVPTLITHGTIASLTDSNSPPKIMVAEEHMVCQGEPLFEGARMTSFIGHLLDRVSTPDIKRLAGNAFETNTFGSWNLYFLSNISDVCSPTGGSDGIIVDDSLKSDVLESPSPSPLDEVDF